MQQIHLDTIQQFNDYNGMETLHPIVSLSLEYPQHFIRFFKALTGKTPTQWRAA